MQKLSGNIANDPEEPLLPHVKRVETYIQYLKQIKEFEAAMAALPGLDDEDLPDYRDGTHIVDANPSASNAGGNFESVPPSQQVGGEDKECYYRKNCTRGNDCPYTHSASDKIFFRNNGGKGVSNRKTELCKKYPNCSYGENCNFAHGKSDGYCSKCHRHGHLKTNCPK